MNEAQLAFFARQEKALRSQTVSPFRPPAPPPTPGTAGADQTMRMLGIEAQRRFGYADTVRAGLGGRLAA